MTSLLSDPFLTVSLAVICSALISAATAPFSRIVARRWKLLDAPTGEQKKVHRQIIPQAGGIAPALAMLLIGGLFAWTVMAWTPSVQPNQLWGIAVAIAILLVGGLWDDRANLPPWIQICFPTLAALCVILSGTRIYLVTNPFGGTFSLEFWEWGIFQLPGDALTFAWLLLAMYATKVQDGLDGLVSGLAVIGSGFVGLLAGSAPYYQPGISVLSGIVFGSFLGFLPSNIHPARQFLGESGGTIAGFSLGVLAILSGAKIAIALCVLAIPLMDLCQVVAGRLRRGQPWYRGDATHLHQRLLRAGIPHPVIVWMYWGISIAAGAIALSVQTRGKLLLVGALAIITIIASRIARRKESASS